MIKYSDLSMLKQSSKIKDRIAAVLMQRGGILPAHEVIVALQDSGVLPDGSDNAYKRAKTLLYHHVRESYYLAREKGDILRLIPCGKEDTRYWNNPFSAPDLTAFTFSLICKNLDMIHKEYIPYAREYIARYEKQYQSVCDGKMLLINGNLFYTIKKQVKHYMEAKCT